MVKLLKYLVEHRISNSGIKLKAYSIAVDALDRSEDFDTHTDSYPRVQMGRLRRLLDFFYLNEGGESRLYIPQGRYEIVLGPNETAQNRLLQVRPQDIEVGSAAAADTFSAQVADQSNRPLLQRMSPVLAAAFLLVAIPSGCNLLARSSAAEIEYPAIVVAQHNGMTSLPGQSQIQFMRAHMISSLERFEETRVFDKIADGAGKAAYLLDLNALNEAATKVDLRLLNSTSREVIWSGRIDADNATDLETKLDLKAIEIASEYGAISQNEWTKHAGDFEPGYPCLLQFQHYIRYRVPAQLKPSVQCLQKSADQNPTDAYLLSMLAVAKGISERFSRLDKSSTTASQLAMKAVALDPRSASAAFAVAQTAFFNWDCRDGAGWGRKAVQLNPLDSRIMGYVGIHMIACGMEEGEEFSAQAVAMDPNVDLAVVTSLAIRMIEKGEPKQAKELSVRYLSTAENFEPMLEIAYILSLASLEETVKAKEGFKKLALRAGLTQKATPREVMSKWIANPRLVDRLQIIFDRVEL